MDNTDIDGQPDKETPVLDAQAVIAQELNALRKLALQLRRMAPTADNPVLRAILGKREALLDSLRARLARAEQETAGGKGSANALLGVDVAAKSSFAQVIADIAAMDQESSRVLKQRTDSVAADLRKLKAGRKWRESCQR